MGIHAPVSLRFARCAAAALCLLLALAAGRSAPARDPGPLPGGADPSGSGRRDVQDRAVAPEFPVGLEWLNTEAAIPLRSLRGKIVLLDFWTYGCINCMHIAPQLKQLEAKYANQLVVIGVHSAKFANEQGTDRIREAVLRYEIDHPVINDRDFAVWRAFGVHAWPTVLLIDPGGRVVGAQAGEGVFEPFDARIAQLVSEFRAAGQLDEKPLQLRPERAAAAPGILRFPGKVLADEKGDRLFISDSNHNRVIVTRLGGTVVQVIGSGEIGARDGGFADAEFHGPQGLALDGDTLYVCDTGNHTIRRVDLRARSVETWLGSGRQAQRPGVAGTGTRVALNSPWDALVRGGKLYIAMAGPHELWVADLKTRDARPYAGSGREGRADGALLEAALAQPSGITTDGSSLFFADSESSSIRSASLDSKGEVHTLIGKGLFDFGDVDGAADRARLQHPLGVVYAKGKLYVSDTYNHKIKQIDLDPLAGTLPVIPQAARSAVAPRFASRTFAGTGERGARDGAREQAQFNEPGGISATSQALYVADTNNHVIRRLDLASGELSTLELKGLEKLTERAVREFRGREVTLPERAVAPGADTLVLSYVLPPGFELSEQAPFYLAYKSDDSRAIRMEERARNLSNPKFPLEIPFEAVQGQTTATVDAVIYFCNTESRKVCLVDSVRARVPLEVTEGGPAQAPVEIEARAAGR